MNEMNKPDGEEAADTVNSNYGELSNISLQSIQGYRDNILSQTPSYGRENAIADSQGVVANIFRDYRNTDLPKIYQSENSSGGYNGTTSQLLANDAFGAATSKAAEATLRNIVAYRQLQQNDYTVLAQLFGAAFKPFSRGSDATTTATNNAVGGLLGSLGGSLFSSGGSSSSSGGTGFGTGSNFGNMDYGTFL